MEHATAGDEEPTLVSAIQVLIDPTLHGRGLSALMLGEMRRIAAGAGFQDLVAPVRPSGKSAYPLTPMERYAAWTTADGLPVRPVAAGARPGGCAARQGLPRVDDDPRHRRGLGGVDGNALPRDAEPTSFREPCSRSRSTSNPIEASTSRPTSGCTTRSPEPRADVTARETLGGELDRLAVRDHETVAGERLDGFRIDPRQRPRAICDEPEHLGAPLPERPLEATLLSGGLVAGAA